MPITTIVNEGCFDKGVKDICNTNFAILTQANLYTPTAITTTVGTTILASQFSTLINRSGPTANFTDTTDSGTAIATLLIGAGYPAGSGGIARFISNNTPFQMTLSAGSGVTITGSIVIPAQSTGFLLFFVTSTTTINIQTLAVTSNIGALPATTYNAAANTAAFTATAAQMAGATDQTLNLTGTLAASANITTPTAANIIAGIPNASIGASYKLRIINSSAGAFSWTVVGNTGVTVNGTATIAQNTFRDFYVTYTAAATIVMQSIGTGTNS